MALPAAASNPGDLDTTFNGTGKVTTDFSGGNDIIQSVAIQSDGKIVVGGVSYPTPGVGTFALARYNTNGSPDTTFNGTGKVTTSFGAGVASIWSLAIYKTGANAGKIVAVGGTTASGVNVFALARYNTDGSLDTTTFGSGTGKVTTAFGTAGDSSPMAQAFSVAIQSDDKLVLAGAFFKFFSTAWDMALARYNADGSLDTSFASTGKVITDIGGFMYGSGDAANSVAIQSDGKIVAAGYGNPLAQGNSDFALVRYTTSGVLDTSFGGSGTGKVTTDFGGNDIIQSLAIQSDGKFVVAGYSSTSLTQGSPQHFVLARYNTNGTLDTTTFGGGTGKVTTTFGSNDLGQSVAIQSDGKLIVAGYTGSGSTEDFAVARYSTAGVLDPSFGTGGKVTTDFAGLSLPDAGHSVAIQSDGKIVVAGSGGGSTGDFAVARYGGDPPPVVPVPGISTYGLIILAVGLVAVTFWMQRRKRNKLIPTQ